MPVALERTYRFSASHRYFRPEWSEEENFARFGKCSWAPGHGHNYRLTVWLEGPIDPRTGFVVDLPALDTLVRERILDRLDHRQMDVVIPEFAPGRLIPSSENVVQWIAGQLVTGFLERARLVKLRLAEDDDLAAVWLPDEGTTLRS